MPSILCRNSIKFHCIPEWHWASFICCKVSRIEFNNVPFHRSIGWCVNKCLLALFEVFSPKSVSDPRLRVYVASSSAQIPPIKSCIRELCPFNTSINSPTNCMPKSMGRYRKSHGIMPAFQVNGSLIFYSTNGFEQCLAIPSLKVWPNTCSKPFVE